MEIKLPCSWREVTLSQFCDVQDALNNKDLNEIRKNNLILAALCNVPVQYIEDLPFNKTCEMSKACEWVSNLPNILVKDFELNGVRYEVCTDIFRAKTAQYADLTEFLKRDGWYKYAECAAVMCLPKGEGYKSEEVEARAEMFWNDLTMDIIYPMCGFFLNVLSGSLKAMQPYMNVQSLMMRQAMLESLEETMNS